MAMSFLAMGRCVALIAAATMLLSCNGSPTAPAPAPTAMEGVWQLEYRITACSGERHCTLRIGQTEQALLRLVRTGASYDGSLTVWPATVDVSGTATADGEVVLTGRRAPAIPGDHEVEIASLRLRSSPTGITGSLEYFVRGTPGGDFSGEMRRAAEITTGVRTKQRAPFDTAQFSGTWKGQLAVRQCTAVGWLECWPYRADDMHAFSLALTQTGHEVSGMLTIRLALSIPVTGTILETGVLELRGARSSPHSSGSQESRLTSWSTRRDPVGRMTGTFGLALEWPGDGSVLYSTTYAMELVSTSLAE